MARFTYIPNRVIDTDGISDGANIYFYSPGTTTPVTVYSDAGFTTPVSNPYPVAAGAAVPPLYHNESGGVRVKVVDSSGATVSDDDPWSAFAADVVSLTSGDDLQDWVDGYATRTALKAITSYAGARAYLTESGREGTFIFRSGNYSSQVTADTQEGLYIKADDTATTSGAWVREHDGRINAKWFGIDLTGAVACDTALSTIRALLAAESTPDTLVFPAGIYSYSTSPNWALSNTKYIFEGEVRFRYSGTGNAVILDGGAAGVGVYNCRFGDAGRVKVECPATGGHAIYARAYHLGLIRAQAMGAGSTSAGLKTAWVVSTDIDVKVSVNDEGWYMSATPAIGLDLDIRGAGEQTSYCNIINPDGSGPGIGVQLTGTLGNNFWGGAFQACGTYGLFSSTGGAGDKFWGTDFEQNTTADVYLVGGSHIALNNCDTDSQITIGANAENCSVVGGQHKSVTIDLGARNTTLKDFTYNRANTGGSISDSGTGTFRSNLTNGNVFNVTDAAAERDQEIYVNFVDDFLGDVLASNWSGQVGTDPQCVAPATAGSVQYGLMTMVAGDDAAASFAVNGVQLDQGALHWRADQKGLELTARFYIDAITNVSVFFGLTDTVLFEMPFTLGAGDALTSNASNAVGVLFDTAADTDQWHLVGVKADADATTQALGVAPVANTFQTFKLYVDSAGTARLFRNGVAIGSDMTNAVTNSTLLTPCFAMFSRTTATRLLACDFISVRAQRA